MPSRNRKKRSKQRAEYLQKQDDILSQENKAKARARYKADPEKMKALYATATRPIPNRRRPLNAKVTRPIPKKRRPLYATATRPIPKRRRPLYATATRPIPKEEGLCTRQLQRRY